MSWQVHISGNGAAVTVSAEGELDLATAGRLRNAIAEVEARPGLEALVVDYARLEFVDSTGLEVLLDADVRAAAAGRQLLVVAGSGAARRLLVQADVLSRLTVTDLE